MFSYDKSKIVAYPLDKVFKLVADVENYPEFLPWCNKLKITDRISDNEFIAEMTVGFNFISEKFITKVTTDYVDGAKEAHLSVKHVDGPFNFLDTDWKFASTEYNCTKVDFAIKFEFASQLFQTVGSVFFASACEMMVDMFEKRAHKIYGK